MKKFYRLLLIVSLMALGVEAVETSVTTKTKRVEHTVQNGETLFIIAKRYHSTSSDIQKENVLEKDETLTIGQVITVPIDTYFPTKQKVITLAKNAKSKYTNTKLVTHTIKDSETLFTVAKLYHSTSADIQKENAFEKDARLKIGQVIIVPIDTYFPTKQKVITLAKNAKSKYTNTKLVIHTIKDSETLFTVAKLYHSTSADIQKENALKKDERLKIGQVIIVPRDTYFPTKKKVITLAKNAKSKYTHTPLVLHTINKGETLFTIARQHHTTIDEVAQENSIKSNTMLKLGEVLIVPINTYDRQSKKMIVAKKSTKVKTPKIKLAKHTIKEGETLFIVARKYHSTIKDIQKKNNLKKDAILKLGAVLSVPKNTYFPHKSVRVKKVKVKKPKIKVVKYSIKKGETLFTIARKHHTTLHEIRKKNGFKRGDMLRVGRVIKVPTNTYKIPKKQLAKVKANKQKRKKYAKAVVKKHKNKTKTKNKTYTKVTRGAITTVAKKKLGRRYVWGATGTKNTFDCSGFTKYVYQKNGINIPRTSINQSKFGKYISRDKLRKGDLIFFDTSKKRKGYVNHVGIYIGNGKFIHASSAKKKVVITKLAKFYLQRYRGARRPS